MQMTSSSMQVIRTKFLHGMAGLACVASLAGTAMAAADPAKVLHVTFEQPDDGFDHARTNSQYTSWAVQAIFEPLLDYDYLARPVKLLPNTITAMPEISADGLVYTFHLKKGIYFTPDPAFKGVRRELVANDYAYTIKRLVDPKNRSPQASSYEGKIVGLDAVLAQARKTDKFDYDAPVAGFDIPDPYTLRVHLSAPDQTFLFLAASAQYGAMAREVVEFYGPDLPAHPVGTGAYKLVQYLPHSKIIMEANPDFRGRIWDYQANPGDARDEMLVKQMKGKMMPQIGRIEIAIMEEEQARWLAFDSGQTDLEQLSDPASPKVLDKGKLKPAFVARGITIHRFIDATIGAYTFFNFRDPVTGGTTPDKIALRRAIAMSYRNQDEITQVRYGQALNAQGMVPPGIIGHDPAYRYSIGYDPELAKKLLDRYGYKVGPKGIRTNPDGSPLTLKITSQPNNRDKARMEVWKRSLDAIQVHADFPVSGFADNLKAAYRCELMMWGLGSSPTIPDGIDFLDPYYSKNAGVSNKGCYNSPAFDALYLKARAMPDSPERTALYNQMQRQIEADTAIILHIWRYKNWIIQPWLKGFKKHPIIYGDWRFLDIEK
jgi:ABC-type transport system substrate-binding protein